MISPETFVNEFKEKSLEECIRERNSLIRSIQEYEKYNVLKNGSSTINNLLKEIGIEVKDIPSQEDRYGFELLYLIEITKLIVEKTNIVTM